MNYYVVQILCVNGHGSPFWSPSHRHGHQTMDQTTNGRPPLGNQAIGTATNCGSNH